MKIVLMGEPMGLYIAEEPGPLDQVERFSQAIAGAEYNVAVGLARLGHTPVYCTQVGDDPMGKDILAGLEANGISAAAVTVSDSAPTGYMKKSLAQGGDPEIAYYRAGSAASKFTAGDVDKLDLSGCEWLHVTGIFPAVSESAHAATLRLIERAKKADMTVSFDSNLRPQLWPSEEAMVRVMRELAGYVDIILPGIAEAKILMGRDGDEQEAAAFLHGLGPKKVVMKLGPQGASYYEKDGESGFVPGFPVERVVDTVGAGDGFAVGVISALAEGLSLREATRRGNAIGAIQVSNKGDNEGLPTRARLEEVLAAGKV